MKPANTLKIRSLGKDWCDKDEVLLHASFQLLVDCVEKENLFGMWNVRGQPEAAAAKRELRALYRWWLKRREKGGWVAPTDRRYQRDTSQLLRLVGLRHCLWT
jgi:hypothetical protein